jgi:hypothetical protein
MPDVSGLLVESPDVAINEYFLMRNAAELLHRNYPGHLWACDVAGGYLNVKDLLLSGNFGFRLKIASAYSASSWDKEVMRAGGEILERYRVARAAADMERISHMPTNFAGNHVADR